MESSVFVQHGPTESQAVVWFALAMLIAFVVLIIIAIKLLIICKIFSKAGYSWALGLLMLIPILNIIMGLLHCFCRLACSEGATPSQTAAATTNIACLLIPIVLKIQIAI